MHQHKGILLFPEIDRRLIDRGVHVHWTMVGDGPDRAALQAAWSPAHVGWVDPRPASEVREMYGDHDIFLLPSEFEGLPVTLLEAGAAGVVPITSDLQSGIPEVVETGVSGLRVPLEHLAGFVDAIAMLDGDRERLASMSRAVRDRVTARFDSRSAAAKYQQLFIHSMGRQRARPAHLPVPYGSRLDRRWIPNSAVRLIRRVTRGAGH